MKIIAQPTDNPTFVFCTGTGNSDEGCGAELAANRADMRAYPNKDISDPDSELPEVDSVVIGCPVCGNLTDLDPSEWPLNPQNLERLTDSWRKSIEEKRMKY